MTGVRALCFWLVVILFHSAANGQTKAAMDSCKGYSEVARKIMTLRQGGEKMSFLMEAAAETGEFAEMSKLIVRMAFEEPRYRTPENAEKAVVDFENEIYVKCIRRLAQKERAAPVR